MKNTRKERGLGSLGAPWVPPSPFLLFFISFYWFSLIFTGCLTFVLRTEPAPVASLSGPQATAVVVRGTATEWYEPEVGPVG